MYNSDGLIGLPVAEGHFFVPVAGWPWILIVQQNELLCHRLFHPKSTAYNLTFAILGSAGTILIKIKADVVHPYYSHTAKRTGKTPWFVTNWVYIINIITYTLQPRVSESNNSTCSQGKMQMHLAIFSQQKAIYSGWSSITRIQLASALLFFFWPQSITLTTDGSWLIEW